MDHLYELARADRIEANRMHRSYVFALKLGVQSIADAFKAERDKYAAMSGHRVRVARERARIAKAVRGWSLVDG